MKKTDKTFALVVINNYYHDYIMLTGFDEAKLQRKADRLNKEKNKEFDAFNLKEYNRSKRKNKTKPQPSKLVIFKVMTLSQALDNIIEMVTEYCTEYDASY